MSGSSHSFGALGHRTGFRANDLSATDMDLGMMSNEDGYLTGKLLVAMPSMGDPRFVRSVIYLCAHSDEGAMGLVINKALPSITFGDLLEQLALTPQKTDCNLVVRFGGPVEGGRGFVLHSPEFCHDGTLMVQDMVGLTATIEILRAISLGEGPRRQLLALGYAGWGPGQLDGEIQENGWLTVDADEDLIFNDDLNSKWEKAIGKLGISPAMLSSVAGRA